MQARIKVIKPGTGRVMNGCSVKPTIKTDRERERETVNTVKGWVADWHERKVQMQRAADALIRSMGIRSAETTQRLVRVH